MNIINDSKFRIISILLAFFVGLLMVPTGMFSQGSQGNPQSFVYAEDDSVSNLGEELVETLENDQVFDDSNYDVDVLTNTADLLQDVGIDILDCSVSEDDKIVLESEINGIDSSIEITKATDESVIINVEEGDLSGTLELKDDGSVWIDGKEVNVIDDYNESGDSVTANAKHIYKVTSSCPYSSAAYYTTYLGSYIRSMEFEKKVTAIPRAILLAGVGALIGALAAATGGAAVGALAGFGVSLIDPIISNAGSSKWISAQVTKYAHNTKGTNITSNRRVWKEVTSYNTGISMSGRTVSTTTFFVDVQWS
jgi:hypothetical protein